MTAFTGFPPEALAFFAGLEADNSKTYWETRKATWEATVREPMEAFLADLAAEFGPFRPFRPYRDVRFSKDKSPYKTQFGAASDRTGGIFYVHLAASGLFAASGMYMMAPDQLERFRTAVDHDRHGPALRGIVDDLTAAGVAVGPGGEPPLKTAPRGYAKDHPRIELLRWKGAAASREFGAPPWLHTPEAVAKVATFWRAAAPLTAWLAAHVGPSREPPRGPGRRAR
jgi:uncharacterized protein (TIGR02453 family)